MADDDFADRRALEDEWIAVRCQLGERAAFDELIQRRHGPIWQYVRRLSDDDDAAHDIAQDTGRHRQITTASRSTNALARAHWQRRRLMIAVRQRQSSPNDLRALAETELSRVARLGQVTLLLAFVMMVGIIGLLGITEPSLPSRARVAFAAIVAIGACGAISALWTLSTRRAVLARHRVIGCRVAVAFAAMIVLGASTIGFVKGIPAAFGVAGFGVILLGGTIALLRQENRKFSALTARRHALAQQLKAGG